MKLSVSHKVFSITLAATLMLTVVLVGVFKQFAVIRSNNDRVLLLSVALKAQQDSDQMHDALRGDATAAILAARIQDDAALTLIEKDDKDHIVQFRAQMQENANRDLGTDANAKLKAVAGPMEKYFKVTGETLALARKSEAAAQASNTMLQESFHEMEGIMAALSESIEAQAKLTNEVSAQGFHASMSRSRPLPASASPGTSSFPSS